VNSKVAFDVVKVELMYVLTLRLRVSLALHFFGGFL